MTFSLPVADSSDPNELQPWLVFDGCPPEQTVALWKVAELDEPAIVLFSSEAGAIEYSNLNCSNNATVMQLGSVELVKVLLQCVQQGVKFGAVDPTDGTSSQLFELRDVLRSARAVLEKRRVDQR